MNTQSPALPVSAQSVEQMLRQDLRHSEALAGLLQQERSLLNSRDHSALQALVSEKQALIQKLEQSARQRSLWTRSQSGGDPRRQDGAWSDLLQRLDQPVLNDLWAEFQRQLQACKADNDINGRIIGRGQSTLRQLVALLRGQQPVESPRLYTQAGDTHRQPSSSTVIKV